MQLGLRQVAAIGKVAVMRGSTVYTHLYRLIREVPNHYQFVGH